MPETKLAIDISKIEARGDETVLLNLWDRLEKTTWKETYDRERSISELQKVRQSLGLGKDEEIKDEKDFNDAWGEATKKIMEKLEAIGKWKETVMRGMLGTQIKF